MKFQLSHAEVMIYYIHISALPAILTLGSEVMNAS